jgi:RecA/RadA recombinase
MYGDLSVLDIPRSLREKLAGKGIVSVGAIHNDFSAIVEECKVSTDHSTALAAQTDLALLKLADALPILTPSLVIPTFTREIDEALRGGFSTGGLHEIVGLSGSGKSNLCLKLLVAVQCPRSCGGLDAKVLYIDTDGSFSSSRYLQLLSSHVDEFHRSKSAEDYLRGVRYSRPTSEYQFMQLMETLEHNLCPDTRLVIIDDISTLLKTMQSKDNLAKSKYLVRLGLRLQRLAADRDLAVVVTNKLTQFGEVFQPRLGESWTSVLTTRLWLREESAVLVKGG